MPLKISQISQAWLVLLLLTVAACALAETEIEPQYLVKTKVWMDGELRGEPELLVEADKEATVTLEFNQGGAWRMDVLVEAPGEFENAMEGAIWLKLTIAEEVDGEWEFLTDTMLGMPPGQTGSISVVGEGVESATPENSNLFVEVTVEAMADAE